MKTFLKELLALILPLMLALAWQAVALAEGADVAAVEAQKSAGPAATAPVQLGRPDHAGPSFSLVSDWRQQSEKSDSSSPWQTMVQGLGLCLGAFFVLLYVMKKLRMTNGTVGGRRLRVVERLPLSAKTALLLVESQGEEFLLTLGAEQVTIVKNAAAKLKVVQNSPSFEELRQAELEK